MNAFDAIPWWLAIAGALITGGVTLAAGGDFWSMMLRGGVGFVVFCAIGFVIRAWLMRSSDKSAAASARTSAASHKHDAPAETSEFIATDEE